MENSTLVTKKILEVLKIKYTQKFIEDSILSHPDYQSILAVADTLHKYNVETLAVKISKEKIFEISTPCIVQVVENGVSLLVVLKETSKEGIKYVDIQGSTIKIQKEEFEKIWTGVCLLVEPTETSGEDGIKKKLFYKRFQTSVFLLFSISFLFWFLTKFEDSEVVGNFLSALFGSGFVLLKISGLAITSFLLWYEVDSYHPVLQKFCSGGEKITCEEVLNSKHAKIFRGYSSLGAIGFSYFFASFLYLLVAQFSFEAFSLLSLLTILTIPVIIISLFYQGMIIRKWCKFCLVVVSILVLEIVVAAFSKFYLSPIIIEDLAVILAFFLIPIITWRFAKPYLESSKEVNLYKRSLKKFKYNPEIFQSVLAKSRRIKREVDALGIFIPAKKKAKVDVLKICNPYCGPCAEAHPVLEELWEEGSINLRIIFTSKEEGERSKPVKYFLALDAMGDTFGTKQALDTWYGLKVKNYDDFVKTNPEIEGLDEQDEKIKVMHRWCKEEQIAHTPTIFINGYELPREYSLTDLKEIFKYMN